MGELRNLVVHFTINAGVRSARLASVFPLWLATVRPAGVTDPDYNQFVISESGPLRHRAICSRSAAPSCQQRASRGAVTRVTYNFD